MAGANPDCSNVNRIVYIAVAKVIVLRRRRLDMGFKIIFPILA
jgi:hypothetical protein